MSFEEEISKRHDLGHIGGIYSLLSVAGNPKGNFSLYSDEVFVRDDNIPGFKIIPYEEVEDFIYYEEPLSGPKFSWTWAGLGALLFGPFGAYMGAGMGKVKTQVVMKIYFKDGSWIHGVKIGD